MKPRHLISAILLVTLLLAYPLSFGPVYGWCWHHPTTQYLGAIEAFYRPLTFICDHVPLAKLALYRYLEFWIPVSWGENNGL
jgi:hypothetical protein